MTTNLTCHAVLPGQPCVLLYGVYSVVFVFT